MRKFKDTDMQVIIGWILRAGIIVSIIIVFIGGIIYLYRHGHAQANYRTFKGIPAFIQHSSGIIQGILTLRGQAIIQAGIILLIATPVIRVFFSAIGFILERDYLYTGITVIVLCIIFASMIGGFGG